MKPALEWINAVGEAVMTAAFAGGQPPGTEVEAIVKAIQDDATATLKAAHTELGDALRELCEATTVLRLWIKPALHFTKHYQDFADACDKARAAIDKTRAAALTPPSTPSTLPNK